MLYSNVLTFLRLFFVDIITQSTYFKKKRMEEKEPEKAGDKSKKQTENIRNCHHKHMVSCGHFFFSDVIFRGTLIHLYNLLTWLITMLRGNNDDINKLIILNDRQFFLFFFCFYDNCCFTKLRNDYANCWGTFKYFILTCIVKNVSCKHVI